MVLAAAFLFFFVALSAAQDRCSTSGPIDGTGSCTLPLSSYRNGLSFTAEDGNILLIVEASDRDDFAVTYNLDDGYLLEAGPNGIVVSSQLNSMAVRGALSVLLSFVCIGYFALFGQANVKSAILPIALLLIALPLVRPQGPYDGTITLNVPQSATGYRLTVINATVENPSNLLEDDCTPAATNCLVLVVDCDDGFELVLASALTDDIAVCQRITVCDPGQYVSRTGCVDCDNGGEDYTCPTGTFQTGSSCNGTTTVDTQTCDNCTVCDEGQFISSTCNQTDDAECTNCTQCDDGQFQNGTVCNGTSLEDTQSCDDCSFCGEDEFLADVCGGNNDTNCTACTVCDNDEFISQACSEDEDTICSLCHTQCGDNQFIAALCSEDDDIQCLPCNGCDAGEYQAGSFCNGEGFADDSATCQLCDVCSEDEYNAGDACDGTDGSDVTDCTDCRGECASNEFESTPCGGSDGFEDRECTLCDSTCDEGQFIVELCTATANIECEDCKTCDQGEYQTGECDGEGAEDERECNTCSTCNDDEYIDSACTPTSNTVCAPCTVCTPGTFIDGAYCDGTGDSDTQATCTNCDNGGPSDYVCNPGEYKSGDECTGEDDFDTQTCRPCTVCTEGQYRVGADCLGTGESNTQACVSCTQCDFSVEYQTGDCTPGGTTDFGCETCTTRCPRGQTIITPCSMRADAVCGTTGTTA